MRRIFSFLMIVSMLVPFVAQAQQAASGDLIKGSLSTIYYLGADGKRYVFPTEKTFFSWYSDFSTVKTISDTELASYPLGGNVTYRPGTFLLKVVSDPKVYAIDAHGTMRWVETEAMAQSLYGNQWAHLVHDLPDPFFIDYALGTPIINTADFSPATVTAAAASINADKHIQTAAPAPQPITPAPAPSATSTTPEVSHTAEITSSNNSPASGDTIQLVGSASPVTGLDHLTLYFDNSPIKTCLYSPCSTDLTIPSSGVKSAYDIRSEAFWIDRHAATGTSSIPISSGSNSGVTLTLNRQESTPGSQRSFDVLVDNTFSAYTIDIFVDGLDIHGCTRVQECRYADTETSTTGTVHTVYAIVQDVGGHVRTTAQQSITVVDHTHPLISISPDKNFIYKGETLGITATASDDVAVSWVEIWLDNVELKHCAASICTLTTGPWTASRTLNFLAKTQNSFGLDAQATSTSVTVQ
ncbi:MAG TPA: Ig-like domain-containing protein [Patescibacteria group bacterium]|nr:Ig-like domain-containing protein [Patescibacteria group bacterium]